MSRPTAITRLARCRALNLSQRITTMPRLIEEPKIASAAGNKPKRIEEYIGRISSGHENVSIARMVSPGGWVEPAQQPEFEELTIVLRGTLRVESDDGVLDVHRGQAVIAQVGERVRYSTPGDDGAEYIAVCLPAFSPQTVNRTTT
jgi:mannose-6-phosphate isomerase-like protein (cupin superfamily)